MLKPNSTNEIASAYDAWSRTYETVANRTRDLAAAALRQQPLALLDGRDALEIGCGTGLNTGYLAAHCRTLIALDFSAGMLDKARQNVSAANVRFAESDLQQRWRAAESAVDLIVCTLVLEHLENLSHIFKEAKRVLRPGGEFLVYELHPFHQLRAGQAQFKKADSDGVVLVPAYLHSISEFVNVAVESKFELLKLEELSDQSDKVEADLPRLLSIHLRASHHG